FFFSSRRRHTRFSRDWSSDVCSSDLVVFANYLLRGFFNYLGAAVLEKFLIQAFHMRSDILLCSELVARIDLRAPSLKVVAVLNGIHTANILIFLAIWVRQIHPIFK